MEKMELVLLLALWLMLLQAGFASRCLVNVPEVNPKKYMKNEEFGPGSQPITVDVSGRITHQITGHILRIFLQEELGYPDVIIRETNDRYDQEYHQIRNRMTASMDEKNSAPDSILNPEVWISPDEDDGSWLHQIRVKQCGPIGPPGRFGWFIPKDLLSNATTRPYWETFVSQGTAQNFALTDRELEFINKFIKHNESSYFCEETFCQQSMYTPDQCKNQTCAVLLAGYADTTGFVVSHIERLHLLVRVVWVGPHLSHVVSALTPRLQSSSRSLVLLSFKPSVVVPPLDQNFTSVVFPPCEEFSSDVGCKYDLHTLTKLYAMMFEQSAKPAFEAYKKITFTQKDYNDLVVRYREVVGVTNDSRAAVQTVACDWLKQNKHMRDYWKSHQEEKNKLYIGGIFPLTPNHKVTYDGESIVMAATLATKDVNHNVSLLNDYELELKTNDGRCEADHVLRAFIEIILQDLYPNLVGILGPACSSTLEPLAGISHHYRTVVISYSAEGSNFTDRSKYPYFFRTIGENNQYQQVYLQLLQKLKWTRLAALTEDGQKYTEYLSHLQDLLTRNNLTFVMNRKFPTTRDNNAMRSYLEEMKSKSVRIIIGDMYDEAARDMMCQAYHLQMTAKQAYVWFLPGWLAPDWFNMSKHNSTACTTEQMIEAINGHFSLSHAAWAPDDSVMQTGQTVKQWRAQLQQTVSRAHYTVSNYAGYAYDAVWMYAFALDQLNREDPSALSHIHGETSIKRYVEILEKTDFNGVSGRIQFRGGPSRISVVEVVQWLDNTSHVVGIFQPNSSVYNADPFAGTLVLNQTKIEWLNPEHSVPKDGTEKCFLGLAEYFGINDCNLFLVITNIIGFCIFGVFIIIGFLIIKSRYDKKVKLTQRYMNAIGLDLLNPGSLEKWEIPRDKVVINRKLGEGAFGYVYGGEALLDDTRGWVAVAVKTLKVGSTPEEKLEFLCEAEVMKRFDHKNLVQLLGVCTKNEPVYTVMEFMLYGDLKTFLLARRHLVNERVGEEAEEISSKKLTGMALDVARALSYLADQKFVHRDIASRNCLVNAARVVKLGDFGMTRPMFDKDYYKFSRRGMLPVRWMSPEALGLGLFTPASDVWSYGVLLYEIITFGSFPFQGMNNHQVLEHVKLGNTLPIPSGIKPQAEALIKSCWTLDYKKRPKASVIAEFIANNPRLLHPCLDVPLASVQIDDSGSVDLLNPDRTRKFSFTLRKRTSSGMFSPPSDASVHCNGFGPPSPWPQEDLETVGGGQLLFSVGEEQPEWDQPLLSSHEDYVMIKSHSSQDESLL